VSAPRLAASVACAAIFAGCATGSATRELAYRPDRRDYAAFQAAFPDLLEPNYLPFMVHRLPGDGPDGDDTPHEDDESSDEDESGEGKRPERGKGERGGKRGAKRGNN